MAIGGRNVGLWYILDPEGGLKVENNENIGGLNVCKTLGGVFDWIGQTWANSLYYRK